MIVSLCDVILKVIKNHQIIAQYGVLHICSTYKALPGMMVTVDRCMYSAVELIFLPIVHLFHYVIKSISVIDLGAWYT